MTVGIYIRVSTQEQAQEGYSISAQQERLISYCKAQGWSDYKFYIDEGVSAKDTNRPQLALLLNHVQKEKINMILVYRLDRFTRSVSDLYNLLKTLDQYKCAFKSATEMYDTSSAMGRMFIGLVALLAQWETENLSERVKMALEKKVSGGERVGGIPYGFDLSDDEKLIKNDKSEIVLDMIDKVRSGMSVNAIAEYLTKTNNDKAEWRATTVFRILRNPALYGATRWNDNVYEGTHEGLISKEEFNKLQQVLDDRGSYRRRDVEVDYLFQGVLICPNCSRPLSVNRYLKKSLTDGKEFQGAVYRCPPCYRDGLKSPSIGEYRFLEALYVYMKNVNFKPIEEIEIKDELSGIINELKMVEKKREKFQRAWAADLISDKEFEQRMEETREIYEELKKTTSEYKEPSSIDVNIIKDIVFTFNENFHMLTQEEKRNFISRFIRKIEFELIPQPPKRKRDKKGKDLVVISDVVYY